jgi:hypothetical protein
VAATTSRLTKAEQLAKFSELQESLKGGGLDAKTLDGIKEAGQSAAAPLVLALCDASRVRAVSDQRLLELEEQKFQFQKAQREAEDKKERMVMVMLMQAAKHITEVASAAAVTGDKVPQRLAWGLYVKHFPELRDMAPDIFGEGATGPP